MDDSEYSLLIHNLTSTIGAANDEVSPQGSRKRGHPSRVPFAASASSSPSERATKKAATSSSSLSTSKVMRIEAEMDELRLENEQARDELAAVRDEFERLKEKSARQLGFLESENGQLKRAAAEKIERYYEEKKKWQAKLRAAEAATASASAAAAAAASAGGLPAAMVPSAAVLSSASTSNDKWKVKLEELEKSVAAKSAEVKTLSVANAELEHTVKQLEQQVRLARMDVDSANSGDASEQRDLRKRLQEVEASLRRKSRELERLEQKSQNLTLLQEENSALTTKVAAMQTAMDAAQALKTKCVVLTEEKLTWNAMFREICKSQAPTPATSSAPGGGGGGGARPGPFSSSPLSFSPGADGSAAAEADVTPVMALRLLSSSQQQAALLLKNQGDLEAAKNDMRRKLTRTEASLHESERAKADAIFRAETAEDKLRLAQQQVRLFDGEIKSLRSMLKTFDAEASIGRPEAAMALKLKDEAAVVVQDELDACRQQAQKFAARVGELEEQLAATVAEGIETKRLGERLRLELQGLQQASGLDFVPGRTRVLHLQQNPSSMASAAAGVALPSTIPMERLKVLQAENKQLADALAAAQSTGGGGGGGGATHLTGQNVDHSIVTGAGASSSSSSSAAAAAASNAALHTSVMAGGADSSKLNLRLKEMFRERITSFREAVYLLTGYKVDLLFANEAGGGSSTHPRLRLRSMYAESPDDSLLFQWRGEALELMQTPFAEKLDHRMLEHLRRCNSVPCFLSNITLELFESQTFQG